jgi:ssDNA-binding Zn-finger/Zn-ribbon topoisomerase 1
MRQRKGKYGTFLGCTGYPVCAGTTKLAGLGGGRDNCAAI